MSKKYLLKHTNMSGVVTYKEVSRFGLMLEFHLFYGEKIEVTIIGDPML